MDWLAAVDAIAKAMVLLCVVGIFVATGVLAERPQPQGYRWVIVPLVALLGVASLGVSAGVA